MIPRTAKLRQQQANQRRLRMEEHAAQAAREDPFARFNKNARTNNIPSARFAATNRRPPRDPNRGIITNDEWEAVVGEQESSGVRFRNFFLVLVLISVSFLLWTKYDVEVNLEVPQLESGRGFGAVSPSEWRDDDIDTRAETTDVPGEMGVRALSGKEMKELEEYYATLGIKGRLHQLKKSAPSGETPAKDADKERRLENYRVRQEIKKAYEQHQQQQGQLVACGRSCEAKNQQVELAYAKLTSQVDRELYGVLLDAEDTKSRRSASAQELRNAYEERKKLIEETEVDEEDRSMALEELKDAYEIIVNPDARKYYLLYGEKPPMHLRHVSARHGGWGQEVILGTFKYRIILAWLDYLREYVGMWGETFIIFLAILFVLSRIPMALKQSQRLLDEMDWEQAGVEAEREGNGDAGGANREQ